MPAQATPKHILETSLLVFHKPSVTGVGEVPPPSDFRATVGKVQYQVRAVARAAVSTNLKTAIVFDLASIARDGQSALIDQARTMQPEFRQMRNISLFVDSYVWTRFHQMFEFGPRQTYEFFLPETQLANVDRGGPSLYSGELAWLARAVLPWSRFEVSRKSCAASKAPSGCSGLGEASLGPPLRTALPILLRARRRRHRSHLIRRLRCWMRSPKPGSISGLWCGFTGSTNRTRTFGSICIRPRIWRDIWAGKPTFASAIWPVA
jgi:hypothetical protein